MKCPPGMKAGDQYQALDPYNGQQVTVQIPPGVEEGQVFKVRVCQTFQVTCPNGAVPGEEIQVRVQPNTNVKHVTCPKGAVPGESIMVVLPDGGGNIVVKVPPGVQPGQQFAVSLPAGGMQMP